MVAHASQQQARIIFVLPAEPKGAAKVQHQQPKPSNKCLILNAAEQLVHGRSIADNARLNAFGEPWTARYTASPPAAVDAVFAGYVSRFVVIRCFHPQ